MPTPTTGVVERFTVEGAAMAPMFSNGSVLDVLRYTSPVANSDIIVFQAPTSPNRDFVKRVIAGPGQEVEIIDGVEVESTGNAWVSPTPTESTNATSSSSAVSGFRRIRSRRFPRPAPRPFQT